MAAYNKFNQFLEDIMGKVHDLFGTAGSTADTCKVYLTNTAPNAETHGQKSDLAEFAGGTGYTAGGDSATNVGTRSTTTFTLAGTDIVWTAGAADWAAHRYAILYNDTATNDELIAWWDYGSSITLGNGETFTVDFGASIFTFS